MTSELMEVGKVPFSGSNAVPGAKGSPASIGYGVGRVQSEKHHGGESTSLGIRQGGLAASLHDISMSFLWRSLPPPLVYKKGVPLLTFLRPGIPDGCFAESKQRLGQISSWSRF